MSRILTGSLALLLLTGCTTHGLIRPMDVPPDRAALLTVVRLPMFQGGGATWVISVDEHEVLGIRTGEHATVAIPPGDHIITSDCVAVIPVVRPSNPVRVHAQAGGHYYVTLGAWCRLAEVTEATATPLLKQTRELVLKP